MGGQRARKGAARAHADPLRAPARPQTGDALFVGSTELRLNPEVVSSDVEEFEAALAARDFERAVTRYQGPFLDGIYVSDAPEFERWVDEERGYLAKRLWVALETLASDAARDADHVRAAGWWRTPTGARRGAAHVGRE